MEDYDLKTLYDMKAAAEAQLLSFIQYDEPMTMDELDALENEIMDLENKIKQSKM